MDVEYEVIYAHLIPVKSDMKLLPEWVKAGSTCTNLHFRPPICCLIFIPI